MITILKAVFSVIFLCCKIVYRILKLLRIRILALYLVVCGFVQLIFHAFDGKIIVFWAGFIVCVVLTLLAWGLFLRKRFGGRSRTVRTEKDQTPEADSGEEPEEAPAPVHKEPKQAERKRVERPKYYNVAGEPDYVFAEYGDRYELYRKSVSGLTLVRTDYKNNERSTS